MTFAERLKNTTDRIAEQTMLKNTLFEQIGEVERKRKTRIELSADGERDYPVDEFNADLAQIQDLKQGMAKFDEEIRIIEGRLPELRKGEAKERWNAGLAHVEVLNAEVPAAFNDFITSWNLAMEKLANLRKTHANRHSYMAATLERIWLESQGTPVTRENLDFGHGMFHIPRELRDGPISTLRGLDASLAEWSTLHPGKQIQPLAHIE